MRAFDFADNFSLGDGSVWIHLASALSMSLLWYLYKLQTTHILT